MEQIRLGLEWFLNPDHLPIVLAAELGWFREEGIDFEWIEPKAHFDALEEIKAGKMEVAITEPIHLAQDFAESDDIVGFGRFFTGDTGVMYLKESGITRPQDLIGKRIQYPGAPGRGGLAFVKTMVEADGGHCSWDDFIPVNNGFYHVDALAEDKADAALVVLRNIEMVDAQQRGLDADYFSLKHWNLPDISHLIFVTTRSYLEQNRALLRRFLKVMHRAVDYIYAEPQQAKYLYMRVTKQAEYLPMLEATLPCFNYDFSMNDDYYENLQNWLLETEQITVRKDHRKMWSNELLYSRLSTDVT